MLEPLVLCRAAIFPLLSTLPGSLLGPPPAPPVQTNLMWPIQGSVSWSCRGAVDSDIEPLVNVAPGLGKGLPTPFGYPRFHTSYSPGWWSELKAVGVLPITKPASGTLQK